MNAREKGKDTPRESYTSISVQPPTMFAILVPPRLPYTSPAQISPTQAAFSLPHAETINHICVFMTGEGELEDGLGAGVYFHW